MIACEEKIVYSYNTKVARTLRRKQTEAEKVLWEKLRNKRLEGVKFKRQQGLGSYIVDFYCYSKKLIIEVDGKDHNKKEQKEKDLAREEILLESGFRIVRFTNEEVINDIENVLKEVRNYLK